MSTPPERKNRRGILGAALTVTILVLVCLAAVYVKLQMTPLGRMQGPPPDAGTP